MEMASIYKIGKISNITDTDGLYFYSKSNNMILKSLWQFAVDVKSFWEKIVNFEESRRQTQIYGISTVLCSFLMESDFGCPPTYPIWPFPKLLTLSVKRCSMYIRSAERSCIELYYSKSNNMILKSLCQIVIDVKSFWEKNC
jgi:hypothetical protein